MADSGNGRFDTYLFDLDGTLIDSIELIYRCYRHTARTHLDRTVPDSVWRDGLGTPLRAQLGAVCTDVEIIEAMVVTYREYHQLHHDTSIHLYPEVERVLSELANSGKRLGVVTSKLKAGARRGLKLVGLLDLFDVVVTADEVTRAKPDPEPVHTALARLAAEPSTTVFIGDSPHDIAAGRGAGVSTGAVLWGPFAQDELTPHAPDYFLSSPLEILDL